MREKPDMTPIVEPKLAELNQQWQELEDTTQQKGQKLFDANRHILYEQSCDDIDGWISELETQIVTEDVGHDLTTVNLLVQKQNVSNLVGEYKAANFNGGFQLVTKLKVVLMQVYDCQRQGIKVGLSKKFYPCIRLKLHAKVEWNWVFN